MAASHFGTGDAVGTVKAALGLGLTFTHGLQPGPGAVRQAGPLGGAPQLVAHLAGEAQEALGSELISQPGAMRRGPRVATESGDVPCRM